MNTWEDKNVIEEINRIGKGRIVLSGLWTSVCIVGPALSALDQGFEVYVITDACGDVSDEAHEQAVGRMVELGVRPMTSLQYLLELQSDWARSETYDATTGSPGPSAAPMVSASSMRRQCSALRKAVTNSGALPTVSHGSVDPSLIPNLAIVDGPCCFAFATQD